MARYFARSPRTLVADALEGFARAHGDLVTYHPEHGYLRARHSSPLRRVGVVSGGGCGHEPLHTGFVGAGMLDAACPGQIFASPHNRQIFEASRAVARRDGVLHIVKNYTGDRINFGIAAERLAHERVPCARVLVDDDIASDGPSMAVGRRGTGATVLVEKVLGAAADRGLGLDELTELGARLAAGCRSVAVASAPPTAPSTGRPSFELVPGTLEYGVGIHGERAGRGIPEEPLDTLVGRMTTTLLAALPPPPDGSLIALVSGLGAATRLELYAVLRELARTVDGAGLTLRRSMVGDYVTALDTRGFCLTLLTADDEVTGLYDAPVSTPAWRW
ncbi:dihydroxyacetone kinase subunit DhaK [Streptomyces sp. NPDC000594]|uniref:dihydroxyacetone kinase subunit DhaK n=1 Tax=Streptomyces sp. NPDC000594 TaxID=3154261 RepID=UPI0033261199